MEQERFWSLLARKLSGEATEADLHELDALQKTHPEFVFYSQVLSDYWRMAPKETDPEADKVFDRIRTKLKQEKRVTLPSVETLKSRDGSREKQQKGGIISFFKNSGMLINYFKFGWRVLFRNKTFSFINITGLSVGMASAVVILLLIRMQLSVDQFHKNKGRTYQLYSRAQVEGKILSWGVTPMVLGPVVKENYPEAEEVVRVNWVAAFILKYGDKQIQTEGFLSDPGFLKVFDFPLLRGDPNTALNGNRSIVITESLSEKLFGKDEAVGKVIKIDSNALFTVTGVMKNLPENTRFSFEYLVPFSYMKEVGWDRTEWNENSNVQTFVLLKPGVTEEQANARFRNIITAHASDVKVELFVHPMKKWHLWSRFENGKIAGGAIETVRMFSIIAGIILLIACINYMNLSTARSVKRAKEVGIRKVAGAGRRSLIGQFLIESILFACLSALIALLILGPALNWFNRVFDTRLRIPYDDPSFWWYAALFILLTGILAGSYPAFYLSGYKPIRVLKGLFKGSNTMITPRKVLVVLQFSFAIALIICTIVIYRQLAFGKQRDPGFQLKDLAFVFMKGDAREKFPLISRELQTSGAVTQVTQTNSPITDVWASEHDYEWKGKKEGTQVGFIKYNASHNFVQTMGLKLLAGRDIDVTQYPTDSNAVLINETAAKLLGFDNPLGQYLRNKAGTWQIVGVVNDFITGWPYQPTSPVAIEGPAQPNWSGTISFRLNNKNTVSANLETITTIFKKYNPEYPVEFFFADEFYARRFEGIRNMGTLAALFAALTVLISCLGLFALATYVAESRIKEIGVRKVLGASTTRITALLSKDFLKLIIISFVVASPVAWWLMNAWLSNFSYRVKLSWWIFAATGLLSVMIALVTISFQSIRAALANPVKSLRTE